MKAPYDIRMKQLILFLFMLLLVHPAYSYQIPGEFLESLRDPTGEYLFFDESFDRQPSVALVLSGGGAHGFAHVGVIRVLEEAGIPVDLVIGTSMGGLVGSLYAVGYSPSDMEQISELTDWRQLFSSPEKTVPYMVAPILDSRYNILSFYFDSQGIDRPLGLLPDQRVVNQMSRLTYKMSHVRDFDEFPIPLRIVGTDLLTGEAVAIRKGPLHAAMRGTMAIPGLFSPHYVDGRYIIDGGTVDNMPAVLARLMGADVVIAVNTLSGRRGSIEDFRSSLAVVSQAGQITISNSLINEADLSDLYIEIIFPDAAVMEFWNYKDFISVGEREARKQQHEIELLAERIGEQRDLDYRDPDREGSYQKLSTPKITGIEIDPAVKQNEFPLELFSGAEDKELDTDMVERTANRLIISDQYDSIGYALRRENDQQYLSLYPVSYIRGKHYFGATFFFDGTYAYKAENPWILIPGFSLDLVFSDLLGRGSYLAARIEIDENLHTELKATIPLTSLLYVEPFLSVGETGYLSQQEEFQAFYLKTGMETGFNLSTYSRLGLSMFFSGVWCNAAGSGTGGEDLQFFLSPRMEIRNYEPSRFPPGGMLWETRMDIPVIQNGHWYHRLETDLKQYIPVSRHGVFGWELALGSSKHEGPGHFDDLPARRTDLGGWDGIPGYPPNKLTYSDAVLGGLTVFNQFPSLTGILDMEVYAVSRFSAGLGWDDAFNTWDEWNLYSGASLGVGIDSILGELVFGVGISLQGDTAFYLMLN